MNNKKVLIVDDSGVMQKINTNVSIQAGINKDNIDTAGDGQAALELFKKTDYDLVLCDINMPIMDGFDFVKYARKLKSKEDCGIFMCTTEGGKDEVIKALRLGANNYLVKPLDKENLIEKIKSFFN